MAGQTINNFDGLSAEAAAALAGGMVDAVKARIEAIAGQANNLSGENAARFERLMTNAPRADGNCGNGCAGM